MTPTVSHATDWDAVAPAHRARVVPCPDCGDLRRGDGPHSPRWQLVEGRWAVVDCAGREVSL